MRVFVSLVALSIAAGFAPSVAFAEGVAPAITGPRAPLPTTEQEVQGTLKTFDPAAVAAARHYYESPVMKAAMLSRMRGTIAAMRAEFANITRKQTGLSDADRAKFEAENTKMLAAIETTASENYDYMLGVHMVIALQIFSKDELVALDTFFSSPVGQSVVMKMPLLNKRLPQVMHILVPKMFAAMKAKGMDAP